MAAGVDSGGCLHLVVRPGEEPLEQCLAQARPGDTLVFLDGGVTNLFRHAAIQAGFAGGAVLYSSCDLAARGLLDPARREHLALLEDQGFAGLLQQHRVCVTWK